MKIQVAFALIFAIATLGCSGSDDKAKPEDTAATETKEVTEQRKAPMESAKGFLSTTIRPGTVPPAYKLPPGEKVLVLVDALGKPAHYKQIKRPLTENINQLLLDNKAAEKVIPYKEIVRLAASRKDFDRLGVANIARALGASQAIYVHLDQFSLKDDPDTSLWHGKLGVSLRVVDIKGETKWPADLLSGHSPVPVETPIVDNPSPTHGENITIELADKMAWNIATLFYKHSAPRQHTGSKD